MKKGDKIYVPGKKRAEYDGYVPTTEGEVVAVTKNTISILWAGTGVPIEIPVDNFEIKDKADHKGSEVQLYKIKRTKQETKV